MGLSYELANMEYSEKTSPDILNNEIFGIKEQITVINVYDEGKAAEFLERLDGIISELKGQKINYQNIRDFVGLSLDINEYMALSGEDAETTYIVRIMEKYFREVESSMNVFSFNELIANVEALEKTLGKIKHLELDKRELLKRKFCRLKAKAILRAQEENPEFDIHSFIKEDEEAYFLAIIGEYAKELANSDDPSKRERGKSISDRIVLDGNIGESLKMVYDKSIWKALAGNGKNELLILNRGISNVPAVVSSQPQKSKTILIPPYRKLDSIQKLLKWFGYVQQTPSYPPDILETELMTHEWVIDHIPKDVMIEWEKERLQEEGYTSEETYLPKVESLLFWKMQPCYAMDDEERRFSFVNSNGRKVAIDFYKADGYLPRGKKYTIDAFGRETEVACESMLGMDLKEVYTFLEYLQIIDQSQNSNLLDQLYMKLNMFEESMFQYNVKEIQNRFKEYLLSDEVQNRIEQDEKNRRNFYREHGKPIQGESEAIQKNEPRNTAKDEQEDKTDAEISSARNIEDVGKNSSLDYLKLILRDVSIDELAKYIPNDMVDSYSKAQAIISGNAAGEGALLRKQATYKIESKKIIYDMFDRQLEEELLLMQGGAEKPDIAIGKFGNDEGGTVYLRFGDNKKEDENECDIHVFLSGKDGEQEWDEKSIVTTDKYLARVLYFSSFLDRITSSNFQEELVKDIVKRIKEKKPVTAKDMVKESKVFKTLLKGYMTLSMEYVKTKNKNNRQDCYRRIRHNNDIMVGNTRKSEFPEGESL